MTVLTSTSILAFGVKTNETTPVSLSIILPIVPNPEALLTNKAHLKKEVIKYLEIFKDHPYVFNLGHGILPETKIEMVEELVKIVRDFK